MTFIVCIGYLYQKSFSITSLSHPKVQSCMYVVIASFLSCLHFPTRLWTPSPPFRWAIPSLVKVSVAERQNVLWTLSDWQVSHAYFALTSYISQVWLWNKYRRYACVSLYSVKWLIPEWRLFNRKDTCLNMWPTNVFSRSFPVEMASFTFL